MPRLNGLMRSHSTCWAMGAAQPFLQAVEKAARDPANDALLLLLVPQAMSDPARALQGLLTMEMRNKPVLLCLPGPPAIPVEQEALSRACLPVFRLHQGGRTHVQLHVALQS